MKLLSIGLLACAALLASQAVSAQGSGPSAGAWEFTLGPVYTLSKSVNFEGGSSAKLESSVGGRFGIAYYLTDEFSFGGDFAYGRPNLTANVIGANGTANFVENGRATINSFNFTGTYHLLDGAIRPFALLGVGWNWVSTDIASGPPVAGCWWDPWWGYICSGYQPTHGASSLTGQLGLGVQLNFNESFAVNVDYRETWIQLQNANGTPGFGNIEALFIWRFGGGY
ncbi:MAG TPA: outer membrane beta-barrel protein [Steroidobacteraceae bacterium]|nr:outer membrane beta-barrel protein [Terriglobales bacterium]HXZ59372.1 outer membrane beta-barrel protein [Steroidobacteraceae bacterium]